MKKTTRLVSLLIALTAVFSMPQTGSAQVKLPTLGESAFATGNIQLIMDGENEVGIVSREWINCPGRKSPANLIYLPGTDRIVDLSAGYEMEVPNKISWNRDGSCTQESLAGSYASGVYITAEGKVTGMAPANARNATLRPLLLQDKRGSSIDKYALVKLSNNIWLRENLRATRWHDGSEIATGLSKAQWEAAKEAALTFYDGKPENAVQAGALYNHYAVTDARGLAPKGWRIPSSEEWKSLVKYIDPAGVEPDPDDPSALSYTAGEQIKTSTGWITPPNPGGSTLRPGNNAAMLGLAPAGSTSTSKFFNGYSGKGLQAYFWTGDTYEYEAGKGMFIRLYWDSQSVNNFFDDKFMGFSVRCIAGEPLKLSPLSDISGDKINLTVPEAGKLSSMLTDEQIAKVSSLTLSGDLDARDFGVIRKCTLLTGLTLENITIAAYKGDAGPVSGVKAYPEETIPAESFKGMSRLTTFTATGNITSVGEASFADCIALREVNLPETVTELSGDNFKGCTALQTIRLPKALTDLGWGTFMNCTSLAEITFSDEVNEIGSQLFQGCKSLFKITLPPALTSIGQSAFDGCSSLQNLKLPNTVEDIETFAFRACSGLQTVETGSGLKAIEYGAFLDCRALNSLILNEGLESINGFAFQGCTGLTNITLPQSLTKIGNGAFRGISFSSITLPKESLFKTEGSALYDKTGKTIYYIPANYKGELLIRPGTETINGAAFADCRGLTIVDIPASVREMKVAAFENSTIYELRLRVEDPKLIKLGDDVFGQMDPARCDLFVPKAALPLYRSTAPWNTFKLAVLTSCDNVIAPEVSIRLLPGKRIVLQHASDLSNTLLYLVNSAGETLRCMKISGETTIIDASEFPAGIYILCLRSKSYKLMLN